MNADIRAFLEELREHPKVQAALTENRMLEGSFEDFEWSLRELYRLGGEHPQAIEILDEVSKFLARKDRTLKERLDKYGQTLSDNIQLLKSWSRENERPARNHA